MSERARTWFIAMLIVTIGYLLTHDREVVVFHQIRTSPGITIEHLYQYYPFGDPRGRYVPQDVI